MNWLKQLFGLNSSDRRSKVAAVARPLRSGITLETWQKSDTLVAWARTSEEFNLVLSLVRSHQPSGFPMRGQVVTDIQCAIELGRHEGYADLSAVLLALRQFPVKVKEEIAADYDDTEYPEANQA